MRERYSVTPRRGGDSAPRTWNHGAAWCALSNDDARRPTAARGAQ